MLNYQRVTRTRLDYLPVKYSEIVFEMQFAKVM